ncbi:uncharacterized protein LOC103579146 isoform X2 [Microplitis demolitor]|uniref:uncharacterized protein LOC103579146 isoform X2 n=1 Tax=Microplitis demolitor TaxID=69319 RepID=UPI0004CD6E46|nr:uncharacterized protein LOC103579146 isoform X2 [Microplitis demolitor]
MDNKNNQDENEDPAPDIPLIIRRSFTMTQNVLKIMLDYGESSNQNLPELFVQIKRVRFYRKRFFCIVSDGSEKLLKCMFSKTLTHKIGQIELLEGMNIKITDYYVHRFNLSQLKKDSTEGSIDLIGITNIAFIKVDPTYTPPMSGIEKRAPVNPVKVTPIEANKIVPVDAGKIAPANPIKIAPIVADKVVPVTGVKTLPVNPVKTAPVNAVKTAPAAPVKVTTANTGVRKPQANEVKISKLTTILKSSLITGKIRIFPRSFRPFIETYFLITDSSGGILCWLYFPMSEKLRRFLKDGFTIEVSGAVIKKNLKIMRDIPPCDLEMIINSTSTVNIYNNDKECIFNYKNPPKLLLDSDPYIEISTSKYPLLQTIRKRHPAIRLELIAVLVDQSVVQKKYTDSFKHLVIQDESIRMQITLWKELAENFSIPNGEIIMAEDFFTTIHGNIVGLSSRASSKIIIATNCADKTRLKKWYKKCQKSAVTST